MPFRILFFSIFEILESLILKDLGRFVKHDSYSSSHGLNEEGGPITTSLLTNLGSLNSKEFKYAKAAYTIEVLPAPGTEKLQEFCENAKHLIIEVYIIVCHLKN